MPVCMSLSFLNIIGGHQCVQEKGQPQPYVLSTGSMQSHGQLFLIVDCRVVCELKVCDLPIMWLTLFLIFAMQRVVTIIFHFSKYKCSASVKHLATALHHLSAWTTIMYQRGGSIEISFEPPLFSNELMIMPSGLTARTLYYSNKCTSLKIIAPARSLQA
jgi:hypothetical protein